MTTGYHETRFAEDKRRNVVWGALWRSYFSKHIGPEDCVLDLGAGRGEFTNNVTAKRRIAIDMWSGFPELMAPGVETIVGDIADLNAVADGSVDFAFASNVFEHVTQDHFAATLKGLKRVLSDKGRLTILQPNYRYAVREYFDDYTHIAIWSHVSIADFLEANGYEVVDIRPKFLPLTVKSRLPVHPFLIRSYLASPFKPLAKQMLIVAKPRRER